jgi:hypothetical protein
MNTIFLKFKEACDQIEQEASPEKKSFLRYLLMQCIQVEAASHGSSELFGNVDLRFIQALGQVLYDKKQTTISILQGNWRDFELIPDDS